VLESAVIRSIGRLVLADRGWFNEETNLNIFFQFGMAVEELNARMVVHSTLFDNFTFLYFAREWLDAFLAETWLLKLRDSRAAALSMLEIVRGIMDSSDLARFYRTLRT
jgi:hypothetical protein